MDSLNKAKFLFSGRLLLLLGCRAGRILGSVAGRFPAIKSLFQFLFGGFPLLNLFIRQLFAALRILIAHRTVFILNLGNIAVK